MAIDWGFDHDWKPEGADKAPAPQKAGAGDAIDWGYEDGWSPSATPKQNTGLLGDLGTDLKRGALKLPGAVTGLADIPVGIVTGERKVSQWADSVGEATGFQPGKWADEAAKEYSPKRQAGAEEIDKAWEEGGAADIAGAYLRNPGNVAGMVAESLPSMVAGGLAGRAAMGVAGLAGRSLSPAVAGAAGEAAVSAGQTMDQISDDVDARRAATAAAATGALTGAFGYAGGRAAQRLGLLDPESAIAGGVAATATDRPPRGLASRMLAGAMSEGAFEELPQSVQEQMWQNWAEGRDLSEGVARSAVEGTIAGGAMGAAANVMPARRSPQPDGGPSLTIEPEFGIDPDQRALPSPVSTGTPNEQVLQAEVERANEVAAADARTAELYRQRSEVEAQRAGIDPQGGPLQKAAATALDQHAADLDAASQPTNVEGPQRQPPVRERDYVPPPSGSFSTMDDLAELVGRERQDIDQRRAAIAETQAQRRDFEFEEADRRVAEQMQREPATRRRMVLDAVLEDPETANHAERFAATLKRFGFRDATPTEDELATIRRFENVRAAQPAAPEVEASTPNQLDAGALGIRERQERPSQPAGGAQSGAGGDSPAAATGTTVATRPPVRFASPEAEQRAGRALPVASEGGARKKADEITKRRGELFVAIPHPTRAGRFAVVPNSTLAPPAADISGQQINRRWTSFSTDSGTLAIPRAQMPQIHAEHRGAMVNFLSARGVQSTQEELSPESLKPTQAEFSPEKVRRAMGRRQGNRSILVSSDGYVLDGHHQWLAAREEGQPIKTIRLDAPIRDLINLAREFPSSTNARGAVPAQPGQAAAAQLAEQSAGAALRASDATTAQPGPAQSTAEVGREAAAPRSRLRADPALTERAAADAESLRAMVQDAGWAEEGGRLVRNQDGSVTRTKWIPRAEWFAAGMQTDPGQLAQDLERVLAGEGAPVKSRRTIEGMLHWLDAQRGEPVLNEDASMYDFEAAGLDGTEPASVRVAIDAFDDADPMTEHEEAEAMRVLGFTDEEIQNAIRPQQAQGSEGGRGQDDAAGTAARPEGDAYAGGAQAQTGRADAEGLLSSYTTTDLAQREAEQRAAADRDALEQQDLKRRAQADSERGAFTLTGSDRPADVQAAQGQGGLFDAPAATASPAPQDGTANTEAQRAGIADFGEKLGGARKDRAAIEAMSRDFTDAELESLPLSKIWPADEIDKIEDTFSAAVAHAARAEIPAKPRTTYKVKAWVQKVKTLRSLMQPLREGLPRERIEEAMRSMPTLDNFRAKVALLESVDRAHWKRIGDVREYPDAYRYSDGGEKIPTPSVSVTIDDKWQTFDGAKSVADVIDRVRERLGEGAGDKQMQFDVYRNGKDFFIAKAGDKEKRALKTFSSAKEAMDYRKDRHADLVAAWEAVKDRDNVKKADVRRGENRDRVGRDWRGGKDVTPEQFISELGFRGVEFGNWVGQGKGAKERQGMLNQAYDALMDLAEVVGVPPRAISLDGTLGLGFGSRGAGWASAHFESDTLVINLTKTRGAGSLAHEWFHALDNYFARYRGAPTFSGNQAAYRRDAYITYNPENYYVHTKTGTRIAQRAFEVMIKGERHPDYGTLSPRFRERTQWELKEGVRPEVGEAFADLVKSLNDSPMAARSALNDKSADGYWSRIIERGARAFEGFVIHKMALNGNQNDYLANVVPASDFKRDAGRYPYLLDNEMAPVAEAFDSLFATIQTRETERGTAMFSRTGRNREEFVSAPDGSIDFGEITPEMGAAMRRQPGKIRLERGDETYGERHIELRHGNDIRGVGFDSVSSFVADAIKNIDAIWKPSKTSQLVVVEAQERGKVVFIELKPADNGDYYTVNSAFPTPRTYAEKKERKEGWVKLWDRMALQSSAPAAQSPSAGQPPVEAGEGAAPPSGQSKISVAKPDADGEGSVRRSENATAARDAGMTADALRQSFAQRMPALSRAVDAMLRRGDAGKKGGAVVIDTADETEIARAFASKTGRKFDEVVQYFRSEDTGDIQGFYDPRSGITFLVGPNLTAESAPAVLLHEMTHSQQRADIDAKAMRLLADRDFMPMRRELLQFLDRVAARMDDAGETGNAREATAYIVEEAVLRGRQAGFSAADGRFMDWVDGTLGKGVGAIIRDFVAMARAWALRHGGMLRNPSVDDLVAVAVAGAKRAARGDVVTSGGTTMASTAADALQAKTASPEFKEWFGTSKMVGAEGRPLVFLHGSPNAFDAFDNGRLGESSSHTSTGLGHFFTRNRSVAEKYADGGHIYRGWLRMQKPYVMSLTEAQGFDSGADAAKRRQALQKQGFDGAIILDDTKKPWAFVVFEPWQFKSTDNRGTFDEFDDRFRFSRADGVRVSGVEELHRILVGDPVATLRTDEAPHQGKAKLREWAVGIFRDYGFHANNPQIGRVLMDERSVRDSLGHSLNPFKAVAFKAVPDVIERGAIAHIERKGKVDSIYISAPVVINGADDVVTVLVHRDVNSQRMYLHSVATKESLLRSSQSSADAEASGRSGTVISGGISKILREALNYKDIRFSRAGAAAGLPPRSRNPSSITATWDAPEPSKLDNLLYTLQNKQIDMKRVVDAVKEKIGQIEDAWNPYLQEELFHGRSAKGVKDFLTHEMRPLLVEMRMTNVSMADFERFLHARHAPEANAHIAKINPNEPDLQDGGSGMTNKEAADHLASLDPARRKTLERLAKRIDAINANTRKLLVDSGLETAETVKAWEAAYKHYVPLQREDAEAGGLGIGQGFSVRGSAAKRRTGSKKAVVDILANIAMQRERTITRAEKNRVAQANYALALKAPNPDFWMPVNPDEAKAWAPAQRQKIADELTRMGLDPADAQNFVKEPVQRYVDPRTGLVSERINPVLRSADSVLAVRIDGKDRFVFFNRGDERAQRMVHALKNLDADQLGRVLQVSAKLTRWFAAVNTQYNPVFGVVNLTRDVQAALLQLSTTPIRGAEKAVLRNTMPAMRGIYAALRAERDGKAAPTDQWAQLFEEFQNEGGQTGYRDQFSSSQARADALQKELDPEGWMDSPLGKVFTANGALKVPMAQAQKMAGGLFGWLSDYNDTLENSVRLAAYKAAKDRGMTRQQAASVAKNLTVNFNRKGQIATQAGAMYAFFNAAMQGTTRMVQTLRGPAGKKIIAGGLSLGVLQALTLAAAGFDDDDPPEFVRERSIVIPIGGGKYVSIPMPLGFHVIPSTSRIMTEWALSGFKDTPRRFGDFMALFADTFNPIGNAGWSMQTLAPTALDPLAALAENRDWTGKPIAQEDFNSLRPSPGHARAKDTASELSKALSYWFNLASGGTDYKPGLISPTPDQIDYLIGQVTGGVGREYLKAEQTAMSVLTGEELPPHKIPLLGRFYGDTTGQSSESARFYNNLREINLHRAEVEGRRRDHGDVAGYLQDNPSARLALGGPVAVENHVRKLRKAKEQAVEAGQTARVKMIDSQITALMRGFNERVAALDG